ncbi:MAG: hypothetical protein ABSG05_00350 [Candidatus Pacearchaeota archaeon]|jgi:hypothetical protein
MLTERLPPGMINRTLLKRENQRGGIHLGKTLIVGVESGKKLEYVILARIDNDIRCYHFTEFVPDERGLVIRDGVRWELSDVEKDYSDELLKKYSL